MSLFTTTISVVEILLLLLTLGFDISFDSLAPFINHNIPIEFYKHFIDTLKHDIFNPVQILGVDRNR